MTFTTTVSDADASGAVAAMYEHDRANFGAVANFTRAFSVRPEVYAAWRGLNGAIRESMPLRRYELATLAAARALRSSYCALAHGTVVIGPSLGDDAMAAGELRAAMSGDRDGDGLTETERAVMALAEQVVNDAVAVTEADVARLRDLGLDDAEIVDVVLAAAARCFFSKTLDALGVAPDARYGALAPELRDVLVVGRPIADS